jgi:predicted secreted protein
MKIKFKQILLTTTVIVAMIFYHYMTSIAQGNSLSLESAPTGWQNIIGDRVAISLPSNYRGGKPSLALDSVRETLKKTNSDLANRLDLIQQNKEYIALFAVAFDNSSNNLDNVNITFTKADKNTNFDRYLEKCRSQLAVKYKIEESNLSIQPQKNLKRIIAKTTIAEQKIAQVIYLLEHNQRFWSITHSIAEDELDSRLPEFDRSAATLQFI